MADTTITRPSAPDDLCVSVAEVQQNLGRDDPGEAADIRRWLLAAQRYVEGAAGTFCVPVGVVERFTGFPASGWCLRLDCNPVRAVASVEYLDAAGDEQTLAATEYRVYQQDGRTVLRPAHAKSWPATAQGEPAAVTVTYTAGPATAAECHDCLAVAVKMVASFTAENPTGTHRADGLKIPPAAIGYIHMGSHRGYP